MESIYCINLNQAKRRRLRMIQRFKYHQLNYHLVEAVDKDSAQVKDALTEFNQYTVTDMVMSEIACLKSHLRAIQNFIDSGEPAAIICEDDVMFHNNFVTQFKEIMANKLPETGLVCLGYLVLHWNAFEWTGKEPQKRNLRPIIPEITWGNLCYWISQEYAQEIVQQLNKPLNQIHESYLTSELIIKRSQGCLTWPPLAIEDITDSHIRTSDQMDIHEVAFNMWGYFNYALAETHHESSLYLKYQQQLTQLNHKYRSKRLLWISRLGYSCSYAYVSTMILQNLSKICNYEIYVFCTGIAQTHTERLQISKQTGISTDRIIIIDEKLLNSNNAEDHEYFNNYFGGIYHLPEVVRHIDPDLIISLDDNVSINRQMSALSDIKCKFIPYVPIDHMNVTSKFMNQPPSNMLTMTQFGQDQLQKLYAQTQTYTLPHIVDPQSFYYLPNKDELRTKWLGKDSINKFIVGAINANSVRKRWDILIESFVQFAQLHADTLLLIKVPYIEPKNAFGLAFVGEYNFPKLIADMCYKYNFDHSRIKLLHGDLTTSDLNEIYNCCDLGLTTTTGEGWGLIPCEMALAGIPQLVPNFSSFAEIFSESEGLIPVQHWPVYVGRNFSQLPTELSYMYIPIIKSYLYHTKRTQFKNEIKVTNEIPTICISEDGKDQPNFKDSDSVLSEFNLLGHFRTVKYTIKYIQRLESLPTRLQIIISLDVNLLKTEHADLQKLQDVLSTYNRDNYYLEDICLRQYWDLSLGAVGIPDLKDVFLTLNKFYKSAELRTTEAEYCRQTILKLCNPETITQQLNTFIGNMLK